MALVRVVGLKRRGRLLLALTVVVLYILMLSPMKSTFGIGSLLPLALWWGGGGADDMLRFVDPLIGTVNGGAYPLGGCDVWRHEADPGSQDTSSPARRCRTVSGPTTGRESVD